MADKYTITITVNNEEMDVGVKTKGGNEMTKEQKHQLFDHFYENHSVMLLDDDFNEIEACLGAHHTDEERKAIYRAGYIRALSTYGEKPDEYDFTIIDKEYNIKPAT